MLPRGQDSVAQIREPIARRRVDGNADDGPTDRLAMTNNAGPKTARGALLAAGGPLPRGRATPRSAEAAAGPGTGPWGSAKLIFQKSRISFVAHLARRIAIGCAIR